MQNDPLRHRWRAMHQRCSSPSHERYIRYGGRGITVCDEWADFTNFQTWAISAGYEPHLTLDRINLDGDYEPSNCRWVTNAEQRRNTSMTHWLTAFGETRTLVDWAKDPRCVVSYQALHLRVKRRGWDAERALTQANGKGNRKAVACPKGHRYEGDNVRVNPDGWQICRSCHRERERMRGRVARDAGTQSNL